MTTAWRRLTSDFGVRTLLCEGGPTVFGALLHEDLVDELFLTVRHGWRAAAARPRSPTDRPCPSYCRSRSNGRSSARALCS